MTHVQYNNKQLKVLYYLFDFVFFRLYDVECVCCESLLVRCTVIRFKADKCK